MGLRERLRDLGKTSVEHQADALREQAEDAGGDDLTALAPRHPAVVCGTVRTVTLPPRRRVPWPRFDRCAHRGRRVPHAPVLIGENLRRAA